MTKSGSTVHKEIKTKIREVEGQAEAVEKEVYGYEHQLTSLTEERETCYATLATTYLPELEAESVKQTLAEFQNTVKTIFKQKQQRREQLEGLMKDSKEKRKTLEQELSEVSGNLSKKAEERDKIKVEIREELGKNADYVRLNGQAKQSSSRLEQNKKRVDETEREASEKLPVYENNRLFSYLAGREFGTSEYQESHGNLIKMLDSWVARIVDYKDAKKCYDFLKSMPELMKTEVEKRQKELEGIVKQMRTTEDEAGDRHGLPKVLEEGEKIGKKRATVMGKIDEQDKQYGGYSQERTEIDGKKDPYHNDAIQKLKAYLEGESVEELKKQARETPGTEDDKLVARIEEIDLTVRDLKDKAKKAKANREAYEEKLGGLRDVEKKFTTNDYESGRSYFPDSFNVGDFLTGYLLGKYDSGHVWKNLEDNQNFRPVEHHHQSSSYDYGRDSSYSGGSSHSDDSGSSWSSGGGFGGGGWSSGSGF